MANPLAVDPEITVLWQRMQAIAGTGLRSWHRWAPADGRLPATAAAIQQRADPTLLLGLSGTVQVRGAVQLDLLPGDLLLIEPACLHEHGPLPAGASAFAIAFLGAHCVVTLSDHQRVRWGCLPGAGYRGLADALLADPPDGERLRLIGELLARLREERADRLEWLDAGVRQMASWVWHHLHRPILAEAIIAQGGNGRSAAYRKFRGFFGRSPRQELLTQRLALARHLLHRGFPVADCAQRCGFSARAGLTRAFRRRFGHPPSGGPRP